LKCFAVFLTELHDLLMGDDAIVRKHGSKGRSFHHCKQQ